MAFDLRLYSGIEIVSLMRGEGFTDARCYGSLDGTPYDHTARRLVVLATR